MDSLNNKAKSNEKLLKYLSKLLKIFVNALIAVRLFRGLLVPLF